MVPVGAAEAILEINGLRAYYGGTPILQGVIFSFGVARSWR